MKVLYWKKPNEICKCGKVGFSKKDAVTKKNSLERMGKEDYLRVYQCHLSDLWHLTKREDWFKKDWE